MITCLNFGYRLASHGLGDSVQRGEKLAKTGQDQPTIKVARYTPSLKPRFDFLAACVGAAHKKNTLKACYSPRPS
ncbi:hypothetical protein HPC38_02255 [Pasteurellaceae bacterium HPA106]|uniref:hypothetical protein n=1 Tax=Spirabiliibacterium pneumoniae TaxID=221400 RepID=UPI001AACB9EA|nr:hypothetical protein [Spirabiliibacterium pneumoniae]MBE2895701.1 hypothetical protein [Spirabiliibacterium pneumoniae]